MWQQNMALVDERRKQLEQEAEHYRQVRDLQRQQSRPDVVATIAQSGKSLINGILHNRPETRNTRLKVQKI